MPATLPLPRPSLLPAPAAPPAPPAPRAGPPATFRITCHTHQAHLRLARRDGTHLGLFKMTRQSQSGRWGLTLRLMPGTYRYRYYADDGQVITYVSPRDADDSTLAPAAATAPMEGLDAILSVSSDPDPTPAFTKEQP